MIKISNCGECQHITGRGKCKAYPKGIPQVIFSDEVLHINKIVGQTGDFVFSPKEGSVIGKNTMQSFQKLLERKEEKIEEIKKKISKLTLEIISETIQPEDWKKSIIEVNRKPKSIMDSKNEELHVLTKSGRLVTGEIPKVSKFCRYHYLLLIYANIKDHFTTMRSIVYPDGNCDFEFIREWPTYLRVKDKNKVEKFLEGVRRSKNPNLKRLSAEEAEIKVKKIIETENSIFPISDTLISIILENKGYLLLRSEIEEIRRKNNISDYIRRKKTG